MTGTGTCETRGRNPRCRRVTRTTGLGKMKFFFVLKTRNAGLGFSPPQENRDRPAREDFPTETPIGRPEW